MTVAPDLLQPLSTLHPLLDTNVSTLKAQCFTKRLTGKEFYLSDHYVNQIPTLPGVVYIEMARAAGTLASPDQKVIALKNIVWAQPIQVKDRPQVVSVNLYLETSGLSF